MACDLLSAIFCRNCYISVELVPQKGFFSNINPRVSFSFSSKSKPVKVSSKSLIRGLQIFSHQNTLESSTSCPATHPRTSQPALKNYPILQNLGMRRWGNFVDGHWLFQKPWCTCVCIPACVHHGYWRRRISVVGCTHRYFSTTIWQEEKDSQSTHFWSNIVQNIAKGVDCFSQTINRTNQPLFKPRYLFHIMQSLLTLKIQLSQTHFGLFGLKGSVW